MFNHFLYIAGKKLLLKKMHFGKNEFFMLFLATLGIILVITSWNVDTKTTSCSAKNLRNANRLCMLMGSVMATGSIAFLMSQGVYTQGSSKASSNSLFMGVVLVLGIIVTALGSVIRNEANQSGCDVKNESAVLIVMGVFGIIAPIVYFVLPMANLAKGKFKTKSSMCGCNR
jgi:drug/metabolite transporter (DMT)-like permease